MLDRFKVPLADMLYLLSLSLRKRTNLLLTWRLSITHNFCELRERLKG